MVRSLLFALALPLAACFSDVSPADTDGGSCEPGTLGCDCFGNETCLDNLVCNASVLHCVFENCNVGENGCVCDAGSCDDGLVCSEGMVCGGGMTTTTTTTTTAATGGMTTGSTTLPLTTTTPGESTDSGESSTSGAQTSPVTLYFGGGAGSLINLTTGDARVAADGICAGVQPAGVRCTHSVALLSDARATVSTLGVPPNSVVLNGDGGQVATSFTTLLTSGPDSKDSLRDAGVEFVNAGGGLVDAYATGTGDGGSLALTCTNWTANDEAALFTIGSAGVPGLGWLTAGSQACASLKGPAMSHVLCACWSDE